MSIEKLIRWIRRLFENKDFSGQIVIDCSSGNVSNVTLKKNYKEEIKKM